LQTLSNLLEEDRLQEALEFALGLARPFCALKVIDKLSDRDELMPALIKLDKQKIQVLLGFVTQWNTNSRTSLASQNVLNCLLRIIPPEQLLELPNIRSTIESLIPYTKSRMADDLPMESIDDMPELIDVDLPTQLPSLIEQNTTEPEKQTDEFRLVSCLYAHD
ncbi:Utp13 specific WD40 associated domain protein, partial [Cooperia oncophora]